MPLFSPKQISGFLTTWLKAVTKVIKDENSWLTDFDHIDGHGHEERTNIAFNIPKPDTFLLGI